MTLSFVYDRTLPSIANESILLQLQGTCTNDSRKRNVVHKLPSVAFVDTNTDV